MKSKDKGLNPLARTNRLIYEDISGEVLIYDLDRDKAHHLNRSATIVWKHCNGLTTTNEIARILSREMSASIDEELVWIALYELEQAHLLQHKLKTFPTMSGMTRRQMTARLSASALMAIPVILSLSGPTAAQASSIGVTPPFGVTGSTGPTGPIGP